MPHDENAAAASPRPRRERSTRYPGVPLAEGIKLCESIEELGVDGLSAPEIALALGYKNIKTNTFSARLSAARQFGLLTLTGEGYGLTPLAREILHPVDPNDLTRLYRQALLKPPLYADLAERLSGKKVPDATILGNVLYHHNQIIASAKQSAAEAFLESARFAGALGDDGVFYPAGVPRPGAAEPTAAATVPAPTANGGDARPAPLAPVPVAAAVPGATYVPFPAPSAPRTPSNDVRLDLRLWDDDAGKTIRLRAPQSITPASYERFLQAFRLLVRVEEAGTEDLDGLDEDE